MHAAISGRSRAIRQALAGQEGSLDLRWRGAVDSSKAEIRRTMALYFDLAHGTKPLANAGNFPWPYDIAVCFELVSRIQ